ncbi:MAG TPA: VCBS repeat-containing protein, partial [Pyrinomonadaceae bacterium]|nr:VCBS repeat-containing protein [Pyrinomonadaceae bacterium]
MRNRPFSWLVQIVTVLALHAIILQTVLCFPARAETFSLKAGAAASVPFEVPATESPTSLGVLLAANLTAMIAKFFAPEMLAPGIAIPHSSYADIVATKVAAVAGSLVPKSKALEPAPPPPPTPVTVTPSVTYDFDGDGKADTGRWHSSGTEFKVRKTGSSGYLTYSLGSSSAIAAPGDFNGDGKTDACVFSAGTWTYKTSTTATAQTISLGQAGDTPQAGDFDGDGTTDAAIYRVVSGQGTWVIKQSSNGSTVTHSWGGTGDIPITGDWDGDGKSDYTVYRPSDHTWYAQESTAGVQYYYWGSAIDIPIQGDFDGDGKSD